MMMGRHTGTMCKARCHAPATDLYHCQSVTNEPATTSLNDHMDLFQHEKDLLFKGGIFIRTNLFMVPSLHQEEDFILSV
jgi:hypothetical protein